MRTHHDEILVESGALGVLEQGERIGNHVGARGVVGKKTPAKQTLKTSFFHGKIIQKHSRVIVVSQVNKIQREELVSHRETQVVELQARGGNYSGKPKGENFEKQME